MGRLYKKKKREGAKSKTKIYVHCPPVRYAFFNYLEEEGFKEGQAREREEKWIQGVKKEPNKI